MLDSDDEDEEEESIQMKENVKSEVKDEFQITKLEKIDAKPPKSVPV